jgi:hypothetical protein
MNPTKVGRQCKSTALNQYMDVPLLAVQLALRQDESLLSAAASSTAFRELALKKPSSAVRRSTRGELFFRWSASEQVRSLRKPS